MTVTFRNLTTDPSSPVRGWPTEAVHTALERGSLPDWHRIAAEIDREPWGRTSRQVEEILSHSRPYGVAEAFERVIVRARARAEQRERDEVATQIQQVIERSGLSRAECASQLGTSPSRLSTYVSGKVTPSATFMIRLRRLADPESTGGP